MVVASQQPVRRRARNGGATSQGRTAEISPAIPPDIEALFPTAPLIAGEDPVLYNEMFARLSRVLKPADFIEWLLIRDVVDLSWEVLRLRGMKSSILKLAQKDAVTEIVHSSIDPMGSDYEHRAAAAGVASNWVTGQNSDVELVDTIFRERGIGTDDLMAKALELNLEPIEKVDRMLVSAEARRNGALREIDRRRDTFARRMRDAAEELIAHPAGE